MDYAYTGWRSDGLCIHSNQSNALCVHSLIKFKVKPVSPDFREEDDWLKCAPTQTKVTLFGRPISIVPNDPLHPPLLALPTGNNGC